MTARFVNGRILLQVDEENQGDDNKGLAVAATRSKFYQLNQQYKDDEHTRMWGEHKLKKSLTVSKMVREGIGIDSESEYEPEETVTSLSVGMIPEFIFNIVIFIKICVGFYLFGSGLTAMRWKSSIQSFVNPHYDSDYNADTAIQKPTPGLDFTEAGIKIKGADLIWMGISIMTISVLDIMFCLLLWHSVFHYRKQKIIIFCLLFIFLELFFIGSAWLFHAFAHCDTKVVVQYLREYLNSYGTDKLSTRKVNEVQFSLACCGLNGWKDYMDLKEKAGKNPNISHFYHQKGQALIPYSCCQFPWNSNLFCGFEAEKWAQDVKKYKPDIKRRFHQQGCKRRLEILCDRVISLLSIQMELAYVVHCVLNIFICLMVYFIVQKINLMRLEADSLYDFNKLEIIDNAFESDDSAEFDKFSDEESSVGGGDTARASLPTLKEIYQQMNVIESRGGGIDTKAKMREMIEAYQSKNKQDQEAKSATRKTLEDDEYDEDDMEEMGSPNPRNHHLNKKDAERKKSTTSISSSRGPSPRKNWHMKPIQTQTPKPYMEQIAKLSKSRQQKKRPGTPSKTTPSKPNVHKSQPMEFGFGQRKIAK